jgi:hypothetical protein
VPLDDALHDGAEANLKLFKAQQQLRQLFDPDTYELLTTPLTFCPKIQFAVAFYSA